MNAHNLGHKAWVFMATIRRDLAHTIVVEWAEHRLKNEDIPGEAKSFKQAVHTSGEQ